MKNSQCKENIAESAEESVLKETMERNEDVINIEEPKINYRGVKAMPFVVGNETFEKLGTTGTSSNLLVYLTDIFHMKSINATTLINIFHGSTNFATLFGAFLSDTYFGRYKTLGYASIASFMGMVVLTLTATMAELHPPHCGKDTGSCLEPTPWQVAFLCFGLGLLVIGAGGIRPCNLAFGADQFNPNTASGKLGINSFFNWYYFTFTFAMMISLTIIVYVQTEVSWAWGLAIPAFLMFLSCTLFFMGSWIYVKLEPDGSPFTSVMRVLVAAIRKRRSPLPEQQWPPLFNHIPTNSINSKLPYTDQFSFLDKAAIITPEDRLNSDGSAADPWRLCSMQQVEEVKCLARVIPIWAAAIVYHVATTQQQTYVVFQALQSDRRFGNTEFKIPAASYTIFTMIGLTMWIPLYDRIIVPSVRRITGKEGGITLLQKMGFGMVIAIVTMFLSGVVEDKRRRLALLQPLCVESRRGTISSMSALWLVPQLTLIGLSEAFTVIAQVEFYYKEFPENMRSIGGSFSFVGLALSNYLSGFMVSIVHHLTTAADTGNWLPEDLNEGRLDYFYYLVSALGVANLGYFIMCSKWYKYKGSGGNIALEIDMGKTQFEKTVVY